MPMLGHRFLRLLEFFYFGPRSQVQVFRGSAFGAKSVALHSFPHLRGVLAGLVNSLDEIRSPQKAIRRYKCHERPCAADAVDGMEGKRAVGEFILAVHACKFELDGL